MTQYFLTSSFTDLHNFIFNYNNIIMEFDAHRLYSSATLKKLVQEYLPEEFISLNWSCHGNKHMKSIQNLLDNSCGKLMFTSADNLLDHLNVFGSYPGVFRHIGAPITDHYVTDVTFHYDFKKEAYVYKKDIFSCLYQCFLQRPITRNELAEITLVRGFLAFYMRSLDFKHEFNAEIVHFPAEDIKNFYEATDKLTSKFRNTPASKELKLTDDQMMAKWRSLINLDVSDVVAQDEFEKFLQRAVKSMPFNGTQKFWSRTFEWMETAIADCTEFIKSHERQFLPRACLTSGSKALVRLFTAEGINIVMVHELLQSMKQESMDVSSIEEEIIGMPRLAAWTFREVAQKLGSEAMKTIVFVTIEVPGSSFRTQPIPTIDGGYCILATDALFEILNHIISVKKFFQVIKMDQPSFLENFFETIREDFTKTSSFYFVNTEVVTNAKKKFDIFFEKNLKHFDMTKATSVRNLKNSVFTKEDVRKELKHLNLDRFFSNFPDVRLKGVAEMLITILNMQVVMAVPGSSLLSSIFDMHLPCNRPRIETSTNQEKAKETVVKKDAEECIPVVESESQKLDSGDDWKGEEDSNDSNNEQIPHPEETKKKNKRSKKTTKSISEDE
ncbi:hypothetical protein CAEBREN_15786 [Caenorhabditis brenneri]|uniref:DUF7809 domain-containing protein n=1 Tax=Caenorhabditis brenneri TaxID=135651 RepID=G0NHV7_CAEBE|nr:hypothetical protein CAEBREN_15786 [Caenorhabditis brenneri]